MNLTKLNYPLGWTPSADAVNGDPGGLLRMDNLTEDETGCLTLVRGIQKLGAALPDYIYNILSTNIDGSETIWAGLSISGRAIVRTKDNFSSYTTVIDSGGDVPALGSGFGQVFAISGNQKKKDNGNTIKDLGLSTPNKAPDISPVNQDKLDTNASYTLIEGHDLAGKLLFVDSVTLNGSMEGDLGGGDDGVDTINFGGTSSRNGDMDTWIAVFQTRDINLLKTFRFQYMLDDDTNYYWYEWGQDTQVFTIGVDAQTTLTLKRSDFKRSGNDATLDWTKVKKIRMMATAVADTWFLLDEIRFVGGAKGSLNGQYEYKAIHVNDNGIYVGKSGASPVSKAITVINGYVSLSDPTDNAEGTATWFFRRSIPDPTSTQPPKLDRFYRSCTSDDADDTFTDDQVLELNIPLNDALLSLKDLPDHILSMDGVYHERMLYLSASALYLSDRLNPDAIDQRYTLRASGDQTEKNLFIHRVTNNQIILATTKDNYSITGSLLDLPDGTLDAQIVPLGEAYPALCGQFAFANGNLFYVASDGIRVTAGSNSTQISPQLNLLFQGLDRHGVPAVGIATGDNAIYSLAVGHAKLYIALPMSDGTRRLLVYDIVKQTYTLRYTDPISVYVTLADKVLLGYGGGDGNFVRQLDVGNDVDGTGEGLPFTYLTVFDANGQPRNRKDTFTLKWVGDTGGKSVDIFIAKDGAASFTPLGSFSQSGLGTQYFRLDGVTLGFRYAIKITGKCNTYKQYEVTIEYDARPEQLNYIRIPSTNLSTISRKRILSYAFVIDTLGNNCNFTPYIDGTAVSTGTPILVNTNGKLTYVHYFNDEQIGTDISGIVTAADPEAPFEFYTINLEESISEKLPPPAKFLVIPADNYGSPNRKRHTSYKFQIHTRGHNVQFTPRVDGTDYVPLTINTTEKRIAEYFFDTSLDVKGIDIGGTLKSLQDTPFEFYGGITPQKIEVLPDRLESYYIPFDNLGVAARKRVRTLPIIIDTYGSDVVFTPIVDGVSYAPTVLNSSRKQTLYHYFITDVFGTDFGGTLIGTSPFEFYTFGNPEEVEVLPVPKRYDQLQPMRWDKIGKLFAFRTRLIMTGSTILMPYSIYGDDQQSVPNYDNVPLYSGSFPVVPGRDDIYHIDLPKNINSTMMRIALGPTADPFHRYDLYVKVAVSGMESSSRWQPVR